MAGGSDDAAALRAAIRDEAAALVRKAAGPDRPNDNTKARIARATLALAKRYPDSSWNERRVEDLWYGHDITIKAIELEQLRRLKA